MNSKYKKAFIKGFDSFNNGIPRYMNPHMKYGYSSKLVTSWDKGWLHAYKSRPVFLPVIDKEG